jgi:hypothetical protein
MYSFSDVFLHVLSLLLKMPLCRRSGARFQYPLPAPLDPDPKALKWYSWEPGVRAFYGTIGFPDIMDPSNSYTKSDHAQCIPFLLQMVPSGHAGYFVTERVTYSKMDVLWSQLVKEYGRHAKARVFALMRTLDSASQTFLRFEGGLRLPSPLRPRVVSCCPHW